MLDLPLKGRQCYTRADGRHVCLVGPVSPAAETPWAMWSLQGDWYDAATGQFVGSHGDPETGTHTRRLYGGQQALAEEVPNCRDFDEPNGLRFQRNRP